MTHEALTAIEPKMQRAVDAMERDFAGIRTGRASTALVERITVDYYGTQTPLNQVAGISTPDAHLIVIQPWDRSVLPAIEKAITKSDIGLVPNVDGTVVRLNVPPLTEERRRDMVKQIRRRTEEARVEVRNHRRAGRAQGSRDPGGLTGAGTGPTAPRRDHRRRQSPVGPRARTARAGRARPGHRGHAPGRAARPRPWHRDA